MNQPLNAHAVGEQLQARADELDDLVTQLDEAERDAVNAREDYTLAYAQAFLQSSGSMDLRRYHATEQTHEQRIAAELAEQHVRGLRRRIDTVRTRIDVGRSLGAAVRAEIGLGGMHQT